MKYSYNISGKILRKYQHDVIINLFNGGKTNYIGCLPRKSGKSLLGLYTANLSICREYNQVQHWAIMAKEKAQAKEIYAKNIMDNGKPLFSILPKGAKYNKYDSEITYSNNSTIKFYGADNIESIRGSRFDGIIGDELASWKEGAFDILYPCLRDDKKSRLVLISTIKGKNHFYKLMQKLKNNNQWIVQHESVLSLGTMTQKEFDDIPLDFNYKMQEYMCDADSAFVNAIYSKPNILPNINYNNIEQLYGAIDIGQKDAMSVGFAQFINNKICFLHSFEVTNTSLEQVIEIIKVYLNKIKCPLDKFTLFLPHDASVRDTWSGISRKTNIQFSGLNTHQLPRSNLMDGIDFVRRCWNNIFFDENNNNLCIEKLKSYVINENTQTPKHDENSHSADMVRYMLMGYKIKTNNTINLSDYVCYNRRI